VGRTITMIEERAASGTSGATRLSNSTGSSALGAALERIGCHLETGPPVPGQNGEEALPSVTFRAPGALLAEILELVSELASRPPSRTRLGHVWCVESRPSLQGGLLHTLTPCRRAIGPRVCEMEIATARRDSETLAAFFLMRRGPLLEHPARVSTRRPMRLPAARPTEARSRGYVRGTLSTVPPAAVRR
jgi:hypothetical protein